MLTGIIDSDAGTAVGDVWAERSILETEGWRDTLLSSLLQLVSNQRHSEKRQSLLAFLVSLEKVGPKEDLATTGELADHSLLLGVVSLMTPGTSNQI